MAQDIAVRKSSDLEAVSELEQILLGQAEVPDVQEDPAEIQQEIIATLLEAESDEELEQFGQAVGWSDLQGVPMLIHGFRWRPSDYEEGMAVYFVVQATNLVNGSPVVLTTGSGNVLAQLTNMAKRGTLVGSVRMIEEAPKATKAGFKPLWLKTPPQPLLERLKEEGKISPEVAEKAGAAS